MRRGQPVGAAPVRREHAHGLLVQNDADPRVDGDALELGDLRVQLRAPEGRKEANRPRIPGGVFVDAFFADRGFASAFFAGLGLAMRRS